MNLQAHPSAHTINANAPQARKAVLEEYYTCGSCYGKPAALIVLELVHQLTAGLTAADLW